MENITENTPVVVATPFSANRIMSWREAARQLGLTATPVPTFPITISGPGGVAEISLATYDDALATT